MTDTYTGTLISDLMAAAARVRPSPAQWQAAKQKPTQFGDNKNIPAVKVRTYEPSPEDDMERDRR